MTAPKTVEQILVEALTAPNPNYHAGHDAARLDAAEALVTTEHISAEGYNAALEFLLKASYGALGLGGGIIPKVRAARILLKLEASVGTVAP